MKMRGMKCGTKLSLLLLFAFVGQATEASPTAKAQRVGLAAGADRDDGPVVPPSIDSVVSGGSWQREEDHGIYRAVIENRGFEHVSSRLWIEWLTESTGAEPPMVTARVLVEELSGGSWSLEFRDTERAFLGHCLSVGGTNPHSGEEKSFVIVVGAPGIYELAASGAEGAARCPSDG